MRHVLSVDLGGTKCSAAIVDRDGRIVSSRTVAVDASSADAPVHQIVELAKQLAAGKTPRTTFAAAAIAIPGLVRPNGTVWAPNLRGWEKMALAGRVKRSLRIPVVVESDRNAAVLGETWRGAAKGKTDAIVLMIGTGIGAGILSGGQIVRGAHELSGCAGWLTVTREEVSGAGDMGELESLAAGPGIARTAQQRIQHGETSSLSLLDLSEISAQEVAAAARAGDRMALNVFKQAGVMLGYGIANMVSLLDPQVVILGGGMAAAADLYLESVRSAMLERAQPLAAKHVKLVVSRLRNKANLLGCARLAWERAESRG